MAVDHNAPGRGEKFLTGDDIPPEHIPAARRTVAEHATDTDDCAELLAMLGILEQP